MKLSEILSKSLDIVTAQPDILLPYFAPFAIALVALWMRISNMMDWGIGRLSSLSRGPLLYYTRLVESIQTAKAVSWVVWFVILAILAVCIGMTIVMTNAQLSGKRMKVGEAFDAIRHKIVLLIVAFLICWFLKFVGMFFFWVGILVPAVLLIFVGQAILLENKDLFDSFSRSYDLAKANWIEILILVFAFLVVLAILRYISILGVFVACFLAGFSAVIFTVMWKDRST